ncbi:putative membrane protein [Shimwellia blattae DSM 4481 = NBRC 105725]|uniref:Putative membrane protein n=1 Tax=Shimwellia blattae (strain ATCC 29907 / DSM 4481 / JCM 1650 / NBRC 105725 / CDC 9005-74) TaxID=630626 RepID=I2B8C9_SHIBC|nr:putative membrane protein [Shimwellia blattae DSM 4481 = NBRC 105725]
MLSKIASRLLLNFLLSVVVIFCLPWYDTLGIRLSMAPFSILGVAIAIFLGFRNNACYARFNEARHLWGTLLISHRSLTRGLKTVLTDRPRQIRQIIDLQIAWANALRVTLRQQPLSPVLATLPESVSTQLARYQNPCNGLLMLMAQWLAEQQRSGALSDIIYTRFEQHLTDLAGIQAGCERIANTPLPFAYSLILHRTVYTFCALLPFALVNDLLYMTPLISVFISYTFVALDALAEELEDPFGMEDNDLALTAMCTSLEIDLREMDEDDNKPARLRPDSHYRLS